MSTLEVCLSPDLLKDYSLNGKTAVIVDILRATSCMTVGIGSGVSEIRPYPTLKECLSMREKGFVLAGERNGVRMKGFDLGNSPFEYLDGKVSGARIAVTTTNGTMAINRSSKAEEMLIGSFLNISAVTDHIQKNNRDIIIVCAGWKGKVNLEDTLFAGALSKRLLQNYEIACDATLVALNTWQQMKDDLLTNVLNSSHARRLKGLGIEKDIAYCLQMDIFDCCPVVDQGCIRPV